MPNVICRRYHAPTITFDMMARELLGFTDVGEHTAPKLIATIEEVSELLNSSWREHHVVRFRDEGFPKVTVAWRWLFKGVGIAYMLVERSLVQVHLMYSGEDGLNCAELRRWFESMGVGTEDVLSEHDGPALLTIETDAKEDDGGAYLLGMILFAPFLDIFGATTQTHPGTSILPAD